MSDAATATTLTPTPSPTSPARSRLPRFVVGRYAGVLVGLILCCIFLGVTQDAFMTWSNWVNIIRSNTVVMLLAVGSTFVIITGGIDLSIASMTAASVVVLGVGVEGGLPVALAIVVALVAGCLFGLLNGIGIGKLKISFFVVTLGTLSIYQSFALLVSGGDTMPLFTFTDFASFASFVNGSIGGVPTLLLVWIVVGVVAAFVLRFTAYGRAVFAVGSNAEAARLAGVRVSRIVVSVYVIMGFAAGLAAVVQAGRLTGASPIADPTLLMTVIAAVLIGGTSYTGGEGSILGTIIGVLFLGVIANGLALSNVSTSWQGAISGSILILAVGLGVLREHIGSRRAKAVAS